MFRDTHAEWRHHHDFVQGFLVSYEYFIIALKTMSIKIWRWSTWWHIWCMRCQSARKKKHQDKHAAMVSRQSKAGNPSSWQSIKTCFCCGKLCHIKRFCYKVKNKERGKMLKMWRTRTNLYLQYNKKMHSRSICKWIMDSKAIKHMTLHKATFYKYEVISLESTQCAFGWWCMAKAIRMKSIVVGVGTRGIRNTTCNTYEFYVPKLQANLLSVSKFLSK